MIPRIPTLLETVDNVSKVAEYKSMYENSISYTRTKKHTKKRNHRHNLLKIISKFKKNLEINLTNEVKDFYNKNFYYLKRSLDKTTKIEKTSIFMNWEKNNV